MSARLSFLDSQFWFSVILPNFQAHLEAMERGSAGRAENPGLRRLNMARARGIEDLTPIPWSFSQSEFLLTLRRGRGCLAHSAPA